MSSYLLPVLSHDSLFSVTSGGEKDEQEHDEREKEQQDSRKKQEEQPCIREQEQQGDGKEQDKAVVEQDRCTTPGGTVVVVPYRPPSASRTYFMAVSHGWCLLLYTSILLAFLTKCCTEYEVNHYQ